MTNSHRLASVRARLRRWISETTDEGVSDKIVRETILIGNEFYVGRKFQTQSHRAVWFIEEDELKIYGADNQLLSVLSSEEIDQIDDDPVVIQLPQLRDQQGDIEDEVRRAA